MSLDAGLRKDNAKIYGYYLTPSSGFSEIGDEKQFNKLFSKSLAR